MVETVFADEARRSETSSERRQRRRQQADIADVAWVPPDDWPWPDWLDEPPEPPALPMTKDRMCWCLHAIGWSAHELARRVHSHEASIRQMARGTRAIPDALAFWLEAKANMMLKSSIVPRDWRPKPE